jgi:hypothetical protein
MYGYGYISIGGIGSGESFDPDAQSFITAAAITNPTQQTAINTLVVSLKANGIWTKMKAIYPFVGGTNAQHAWNLKNTTQYKITWYGGVTSSSNGIIGNGTNGYGDTFLNNNVMDQNNAHISVYSRTNTQNFACDIGSWNSQFGLAIYTGYLNNIRMSLNSATLALLSNTNSQGFYLGSRLVSNSINIQKNSTQTPTSSLVVTPITTSVKILRPGEFNGEYTNRNLAFASIGDGLTDTESTNLYTAVQTFQTTLGRNV